MIFDKVVNNNKGSAILVVISLIGMLSLVGILATTNSNTDIDLSYNQSGSEKAFYIADAGAKRAFCSMVANPGWDSGYANITFGGGLYSVSIFDSATNAGLDDTTVIVAVGNVGTMQSTVQYILVPDVFYPFRYAMFADDAIDIKNSFVTDSYNADSGYASTHIDSSGDVGSNGNIDVNNGAFIGGGIATSLTGGLSINAGATVTGDITDAAAENNLPSIPASEFAWAEANNSASTGISGTYVYSPVTHSLVSTGSMVFTSGVYYFSDIILKNSASLSVAPGAEVKIYVTGDIEMKNSAEINAGGNPADVIIYSQGDFVLKNSGDIAAVLYAPDNDVDLRNSGEFSGSIVANTITAHNSANFHYDRGLGSISLGGSGDLKIVAFKED
ncbi:MAG: hypothetical protein ABIJ12_12005 [bacterium]